MDFFVIQVEVVTDDHPPEIIETLEEGWFFGAQSLVVVAPRSVSVRAATHVDIFVLRKQDLDDALEFYADMQEKISKKVIELYGE